ncbi:hypothetical protein BGY98DRAFT_743891 [Russula aff. rugulosa BPL654]|nr:hypothetical protein BGY98DRAFT_743891 [Russula aff. rugulosa BPL654]
MPPPHPSPLYSPNGPPRGFASAVAPFAIPGPSFAPPPLAPSALPPGFPATSGPGPARTPFDMSFPPRPPAPIGPPSSGLAPGAGRRSSSNNPTATPAPDVGPIGRPVAPMAPIARPSTSGTTTPTSATSASAGSPSPKGVVLGSSALATEDDEIVSDRRLVGANASMGVGVGVGVSVGPPPGWAGFGSPRAVNGASPWRPGAAQQPQAQQQQPSQSQSQQSQPPPQPQQSQQQQQQQQQPPPPPLGFGLGLGVRPGPHHPPPGPPPLGGPMWGGAGLGIGGVGVAVGIGGGGIVGAGGAPDQAQWHPVAANHPFFAAAQSPFVHGSPTSPHNGA